MKAITLKQPWAFLVCSGVKDVENRTWKCPEKHIGKRVLIHASKTSYRFDNFYDSPLSNDQLFALPDIIQYPTIHSAIIGSVRITGCTINHPSVWAEKTEGAMVGHTFVTPKGVKTTWNWILEDAILFDEPILNVNGKLSFWDFDLPEEYERLLK